MTGSRAVGSRRPGIGVLLPTLDPTRAGFPSLTESAILAERLGFDSVWVGDHLVFHCPYREAFATLSAAAAVTSRVTIGTAVLQSAMRPLAWTAKQVATLQELHGNRMILGVGLGGESVEEWAASGAELKGRASRLDRHVAVLRAATSGMPFDIDGARVPALTPHGSAPPLWVGGRAEAALRRAARHADGYLGLWLDPPRVVVCRRLLDEFAEIEGRAPVDVGINVVVCVAATRAKAAAKADSYLRGVFASPLSRMQRWVVVGEQDEVIDRLRSLREAGATELVMLPGVPTTGYMGQLELLAEVREQLLW